MHSSGSLRFYSIDSVSGDHCEVRICVFSIIVFCTVECVIVSEFITIRRQNFGYEKKRKSRHRGTASAWRNLFFSAERTLCSYCVKYPITHYFSQVG